jgi:hypothetical protein
LRGDILTPAPDTRIWLASVTRHVNGDPSHFNTTFYTVTFHAVINFQFTWNSFSVESHTKCMWERLLGLEANFELSIAFWLDVIRNVSTINRNNNLQVTGSRLTGINCEVLRIIKKALQTLFFLRMAALGTYCWKRQIFQRLRCWHQWHELLPNHKLWQQMDFHE